MMQVTIEQTPLGAMHQEYTTTRLALVTADLSYRLALAEYKAAKARCVLAVDAARDNAGKSIYSNAQVREAEVVVRMEHAEETSVLAGAETAYKQAEAEAKVSGMACRLYVSLRGLPAAVDDGMDEDSDDD